MDKLPKDLKDKLRQLHSTAKKLADLSIDVTEMIEGYGLPTEIFNAVSDEYTNKEQTEALSYMTYGEGDFKSCIKEFERVFLLHVNRKETK